MKIECVKEKLQEAVYKAEKVVGRNLTLPILSCILFESRNNILTIRSTNLDLGLEINIPVKTLEPGKIAVPGNIVLGFLSNLQGDGNILIEDKQENITFSFKGVSSVIKSQNSEDFPSLPKLHGEKEFLINSEDFILGLKAVWYSSAISSIKPELSSVYIYSDNDSIVFVATDSFRLAEKKIFPKKKIEIGQILIPLKNVSEIIRVLDGFEKEAKISVGSSQISFSFDGTYLVSRTIEGNFPDYKQIIPKENKTEIVALKQDVFQSLKMANVFSDSYHQVSFNIVPGNKQFEIKTKNSEVGENLNSIESVLKGEDLLINFNYKYLIDCFQSIESDSIEMLFGGLSKPLIIKGVSDRSFLYLVMPMNK